MSKKFTKTILSSAVAGLMFVSFSSLSAKPTDRVVGKYTIKFFGENGEQATIFDSGNNKVIIANTVTGTITTVNTNEVNSLLEAFIKEHPEEKNAAQIIGERLRYTIDAPSLKKENINKLTSADLDKIKANVDAVAKTITSETAPVYREAIKNGMTSEDALAVVNQDKTGGLLKQFNGLNTNVNALKDTTTFALDENGEITDGQGVETVSVKSVVADVKA
ncbi:TPA: hypothetical protein OT676_005161, partial [Escherichia coli]|nr:hypothetical protein [Escherichia coli]